MEEKLPNRFIHQIRVSWADCDPAKIVYTGRIPQFCLEAIDCWWEAVIGLDWFKMNVDRDIGTPFVHLSLDFRSPITPRDLLDCAVSLIRMGESSVRLKVVGSQDGRLCFEGEFVEVFVAAEAHQKTNIPSDFREKLAGQLV
jgi:4-hydroxybenzoyl-CoA thioesterase